jgi:GT2 family glycosyltransferase
MRELSVVIPTRDTEALTLRAVLSVRASADSVHEIVVVDDGGSDGTAAALARLDPSIVVLRTAVSEGFTRAANRGAAASTGEVILFLNSDTEVASDALPALLDAFAEDSRLGIAGALLRYPDGSPQWSAGPTPSLAWFFAMASGVGALLHRVPGYTRARRGDPSGKAVAVSWVSGAAMAVRRATWTALGPFDERFFFYAQDLDLCLRAGSAGWSVALVPAARVLHHHGATIGGGRGKTLRQDPRLLWRDLLLWAEKARGRRYAARVHRALRAGARCRLLGRALSSPFLAPARRSELADDSLGYRLALADGRAPATREPID